MFTKAGVKDKDVHSTRTSLNIALDLDGDGTRAVMQLIEFQNTVCIVLYSKHIITSNSKDAYTLLRTHAQPIQRNRTAFTPIALMRLNPKPETLDPKL